MRMALDISVPQPSTCVEEEGKWDPMTETAKIAPGGDWSISLWKAQGVFE